MQSDDAAAADAALNDDHDVQAAHAGDRDAFARIVGRHAPALYSMLTRLAGDEPLARAVFEETVAECAGAVAALAPGDPVRPWLFKHAAARCLTHPMGPARRWLILQPRARTRRAAAPLAPPAPAEAQARIETALAGLPVDERAIVLLARYGRLPRRDIARLLGLSLRGTRVRLNRAIHRLAEAVGEP